jgi:hypothetical protein
MKSDGGLAFAVRGQSFGNPYKNAGPPRRGTKRGCYKNQKSLQLKVLKNSAADDSLNFAGEFLAGKSDVVENFCRSGRRSTDGDKLRPSDTDFKCVC